MNINIDNNLILIKGEDKTASVTSWRFDKNKPVVFITFNGHKEYPYNTAYVELLKNPRIVVLDERIALKDGSTYREQRSCNSLDGIAGLCIRRDIVSW